MLRIDVPIIVFHMANLCGDSKNSDDTKMKRRAKVKERRRQYTHGDNAGVLGCVVTSFDLEGHSQGAVDIDLLWPGDHMVRWTLQTNRRRLINFLSLRHPRVTDLLLLLLLWTVWKRQTQKANRTCDWTSPWNLKKTLQKPMYASGSVHATVDKDDRR